MAFRLWRGSAQRLLGAKCQQLRGTVLMAACVSTWLMYRDRRQAKAKQQQAAKRALQVVCNEVEMKASRRSGCVIMW